MNLDLAILLVAEPMALEVIPKRDRRGSLFHQCPRIAHRTRKAFHPAHTLIPAIKGHYASPFAVPLAPVLPPSFRILF